MSDAVIARSTRAKALGGATIGMFVALIGANVAAWIWAFALFSERPAILGTALLAWVFGLRHAVDADHIAAIDNVVRKLMQRGQKPPKRGVILLAGAFDRRHSRRCAAGL